MSKIIVSEPAKPSRMEGFIQKVMASLVSRLLWKAIEYLREIE
jgi:hypothetical protein